MTLSWPVSVALFKLQIAIMWGLWANLDSCGTISDGKSFSVCQHEALINICIVIVCEIVI